MTDNQIVLPQQIQDDFNKLTPEQLAALRWVGYLFVHNILSAAIPGFKTFLSQSELEQARAIAGAYSFDNQMIRASTHWTVFGLAERRLVDLSALEHTEKFFDDMMKLENGVK